MSDPATPGQPKSLQIQPSDVTVAVVLALAHEATGAEQMFADIEDLESRMTRGNFSCVRCQVPSAEPGRPARKVALAAMGLIGNNFAAICVHWLSQEFSNLEYVILCGIAGGAPKCGNSERDTNLADVVVCGRDGVLQYDFGWETWNQQEDRASFEIRGPAIGPAPVLLAVTNQLRVLDHRGLEFSAWRRRLEQRYPLITRGNNRFVRPDEVGACEVKYDQVVVDPVTGKKSLEKVDRLPPKDPRLFVGGIGSAGRVLKNPYQRDELRDGASKIMAVEMEASGVADACATLGLKFTVVRGICDFCDSNKNNEWQSYASLTAAAVAYSIVERLPAAEETIPVDTQGSAPVLDASLMIRLGAQAARPNAASTMDVLIRPATIVQGGPDSPDVLAAAAEANHEPVAEPTPVQVAAIPAVPTMDMLYAAVREFLREMKISTEQHDSRETFRVAIELEKLLEGRPPQFDQELAAEAYYEVARAYTSQALDAEGPEKATLKARAELLIAVAKGLLA